MQWKRTGIKLSGGLKEFRKKQAKSLFKSRDIFLPAQTTTFLAIDEVRPDIFAKGKMQYNKHKSQTHQNQTTTTTGKTDVEYNKAYNGCELVTMGLVFLDKKYIHQIRRLYV